MPDQKRPRRDSRRGRYATEQEWDRKRPLITHLYNDGRKTLEEVIEILETEHGFWGTRRMYKRRLQDWGLSKNLKEDEVLQILRILSSRKRAGGPTDTLTFYIHGRSIANERIFKYLRRKPQLLLRLHDDTGPAREIVEAVTYTETITKGPLGPPILDFASNLGIMEQVLRAMHLYMIGCFDSETWVWNRHSCWAKSLSLQKQLDLCEDWESAFLEVLDSLIRQAPAADFGNAIARLFNGLDAMLKAHPPYFLSTLLTMLPRLQLFEQYNLGDILLKHAMGLTAVYMGQHHALYQVLRWLRLLMLDGSFGSYMQPLRVILETAETYTGRANNVTRVVGIAYASMVGRHFYAMNNEVLKAVSRYIVPLYSPDPATPSEGVCFTDREAKLGAVINRKLSAKQSRFVTGLLTQKTVQSDKALALPKDEAALQELHAINYTKRHVKFTLSYALLFSDALVVDFCINIARLQGITGEDDAAENVREDVQEKKGERILPVYKKEMPE